MVAVIASGLIGAGALCCWGLAVVNDIWVFTVLGFVSATCKRALRYHTICVDNTLTASMILKLSKLPIQ